jgi:hypothetical protein
MLIINLSRIQPLQTNDIRARYISGRHQISKDGRHLVDGIAFGRPLLRTPAHPPVHIPPRKRARLDPSLHDEADYQSPPAAPPRLSSTRHQKQVTFSPEFLQADAEDNAYNRHEHDDDDDDEEGDDFDFEPLSDHDSDAEQDETMKYLEGLDPASASSSEESSSIESDSASESSSDSGDSDSDSDAPSEEVINKKADTLQLPPAPPTTNQPPTTKQQPPRGGKQRTRARNRRRRDAKKLAWLKSKGQLPENANRDDLRKWREKNKEGADPASASKSSSSDDSDTSDSSPDSDSEPETASTNQVDPPIAKNKVSMLPRQLNVKPKAKKQLSDKKTEKSVSDAKTDEFNKKREALLSAIQSGGVDINQDFSTPSEDTPMTEVNAAPENGENTPAQSETRRARLDVASSTRLLFGSLGVRAPKNDGERERLQAKLAQTSRKPVVRSADGVTVTSSTAEEEESGPTDPDAWKSKISLSAVECMPGSEEFYYSTPPFPFYQRWDPSQRTKKRKRASGIFDANKSLRTDEELDNSYSEYYNEGTNGDALDYGGAGAGENETVGAGAAEETDQEAASAQLLTESDLPLPPPDLSILPILTRDLAIPGAIITFSRLEVSAATNWAPAFSPVRTALIQNVTADDVLEVQVAKRDVPGRKYDEQGRRLFDRFETITGDEEDGDEEGDGDGALVLEFAELVDARLLQAAPRGVDGQ